MKVKEEKEVKERSLNDNTDNILYFSYCQQTRWKDQNQLCVTQPKPLRSFLV